MNYIFASNVSPLLMPHENPAGKILYAVIVAVVFILLFVALVTFLAAVLKEPTRRGREAIRDKPVATVLTGLIVWIVIGAVGAWLYPRSFTAACAVVLLPMIVNLIGAPGLYTHIGSRIAALRGSESSDLTCVVSGSLLAVLAACFPFFGWFLILPLLLAAEFGAGVAALLRR